ncbi:protein artichoke-like [Centruroides sculpturatus]|uniref:protein artichoke-like n=1 Tax=Centruroides sculpturatus TaxID=218467 RepID=UPI000C6EBDE0|nr:protein artichoke-like [Centruroides sculpturatus]
MLIFLLSLKFILLCPCYSLNIFFDDEDDDEHPLCKPPFKCNCEDTKIDCSNLKITDFESKLQFSEEIIEVNFQGNEIKNIQKNFAKGTNLRDLDLSYNNINFISSEAFSNLNQLIRLDLSHNYIWNLAVDVFSGVKSLKKLDLSYNNIQNIIPNTFMPTKMLTDLSLEFNPFMYFDKDFFTYLPKLENLNLRYTGFSSLLPKLFASNTNLKYLSLANNALSSVPSSALKDLKSLVVLWLNDNPIKYIKSGDFKGLVNLTSLYISNMAELKNIEKFAFEGLINLRILHCSDNYKLEVIDSMAFATNNTFPLKHIEMIYLRNNALTTLSEKLLNWKRITYTDLSGNPWHCDCKVQWLGKIHWKHDLQYNIRCSSPSNLAGKLVSNIPLNDFECESHMSAQLIITLTLITVTVFIGVVLTITIFLNKRGLCITCNSKFQTKYHKVFQRKEDDIEYEPKIMLYEFIVVSLLVTIYRSGVSAENLCDSCKCTEHDADSQMVNINCEYRQFQSIPPMESWPVNPYRLDLSHNNITVLDSLEDNYIIKELDLDFVNLESIKSNVFQSYPKLEYLDLSQNLLTTLDKDIFTGLENLLTLNFSYNNIKLLPKGIFDPLVKLQVLRMSGNPLRYLSQDIFMPLLCVNYMDLSDIRAHSLPDGIFHTLDKLEYLDLSKNDFDKVPSSALRSSTNLKQLYLSENKFIKLNKDSFTYLTKLELLDLSEMPKLKKVEEFTFSPLSSLKTLKMSSNAQLQYIDPSAFDGIYNPAQISSLNLKVVKLRSNALSTLNSNMLPWHAIPTLDLQGNHWYCNCYLAWIVNCSIPAELTTDFRCYGPKPNQGKLVTDLREEEFICLHEAPSQYSETAIRTIAALVGLASILLIVIIGILILKRKYIRSWWIYRKRGTGAVYYVKAQTNPNDAIDL